MHKLWIERCRAALGGDREARDAVMSALVREEPTLFDILRSPAAVAELERECAPDHDATKQIGTWLQAGLDANQPWATRMLHAALSTEATWAKCLFIHGLRARRHWAWIGYHAWYHPRVVAICRRVLDNDDQAHELAAELALRFVDEWVHGPRPLVTFPGFLWRTARTQALKRRESDARLDRCDDWEVNAHTLRQPTSDPVSIEERMIDDERKRLLNAALASLTADQRRLVQSKIVLQRTFKQIAEDEACSLQNIHKKLTRVLQRIREYLEAHAGDPEEGR